MPSEKNINQLIINKVENDNTFSAMISANQVKEDELYIIGQDDTDKILNIYSATNVDAKIEDTLDKVNANLTNLSNTTLPSTTKYALSSTTGGAALRSDSSTIERITNNLLTVLAAELALNREKIYFGGSDAVSFECPTTYCIAKIQKGDNHRTIVDYYNLNTGDHYINGNIDARVPEGWTGWILQPNNNTVKELIKDLTISGTTLTYTKQDNTTGTITIPDSDEKVKNAPAATTKAYITGTTSDTTNTGTQVFDTGVYLDTVAGQLTATTFKGNLTGTATKATQDASGNIITTTYATKASIPTKVSELENDEKYLTSYTETDPTVPSWAKAASKPSYNATEVGADPKGTATTAVSNHNVSDDAHNDIRLSISNLSDQVNKFLNVDDETKDELSEVLALIAGNTGEVTNLANNKVNKTDIINNLTTNDSSKVLSAAQGVALKNLIDNQDSFASVKVNNTVLPASDPAGSMKFLNGQGITITATNSDTDADITIENIGVLSVASGSTNGTLLVNTGGQSKEVSVKGLNTMAYQATGNYYTKAQIDAYEFITTADIDAICGV